MKTTSVIRLVWSPFLFALLAIVGLVLGMGCSDGGSGSFRDFGSPGDFAGTYSGTFSGDDSGTFEITVDASGNVTGGGFSNLDGAFTIAGSVDSSGSFAAGVASTGATWSGNAFSDGWITGTWSNAGNSGTFGGSTAGAFAGHFLGTFGGDDSGTFDVTIDSFGAVTGGGFSNLAGAFTIVGVVDDSGNLAAGIASTNAVWTGVVGVAGAISGTWVNGANSGTFTGTRQ